MNHLVNEDYKNIALRNNTINVPFYNLTSFNEIDMTNRYIRPYHDNFFKKSYEYSSDENDLDAHIIVEEISLSLNSLYNEKNDLKIKIQKHGGIILNNVCYLITHKAIDYLDVITSTSNNNHPYKTSFLPPVKGSCKYDYMHIGFNILCINYIQPEKFIELLRKFKNMYNVKLHIFGCISVQQYILYKSIADYFYIGNIGYIEEYTPEIGGSSINVIKTSDVYSNTYELFYNLPFNINYAELIYKCNLERLTHSDTNYPKIVVMDNGIGKHKRMSDKEHILSFALGADYIMSYSIFIQSIEHISKDNEILFKSYSYSHPYYYPCNENIKYALNNISRSIYTLFQIFNISTIDELHKLSPNIIKAPWLDNDLLNTEFS